MCPGTIKISLTFDQVLEFIRQMPLKDKAKLSRELAKETIDIRLSKLLKSFRTDELPEDIITEEVEKTRAEIYAGKKGNKGNH